MYTNRFEGQTAECLAGRTFTTSASYGVCCDTALGACGRNDFATACSGVYAMYGDGPYSWCVCRLGLDWHTLLTFVARIHATPTLC